MNRENYRPFHTTHTYVNQSPEVIEHISPVDIKSTLDGLFPDKKTYSFVIVIADQLISTNTDITTLSAFLEALQKKLSQSLDHLCFLISQHHEDSLGRDSLENQAVTQQTALDILSAYLQKE